MTGKKTIENNKFRKHTYVSFIYKHIQTEGENRVEIKYTRLMVCKSKCVCVCVRERERGVGIFVRACVCVYISAVGYL